MADTVQLKKEIYVKQLLTSEHGFEVQDYFQVVDIELRDFQDPSRGKFLTLTLADKTGRIAAKVWDNAPAVYGSITGGSVVKVTGNLRSFRGQNEIHITKVEVLEDSTVYDQEPFFPCSPRDFAEMEQELQAVISSLGKPENGNFPALLVNRLFNPEDSEFGEIARLFLDSPAAKTVHHSYLHGLLEHTLEVVKVVGDMAELHPEIDRDLLVVGALLHDIGKTRSFYLDKGQIGMSDEGKLIGHIAIGCNIVEKATSTIPNFPPGLAVKIKHMVLSHHGTREWGSPEVPQTIEAVALHYADLVSVRLWQFADWIKKYEGTDPSGWTPKNNWLGTSIYFGGNE